MQTEHIKVTGMRCGGCTSTVTRRLQATSEVDDVKMSLPVLTEPIHIIHPMPVSTSSAFFFCSALSAA